MKNEILIAQSQVHQTLFTTQTPTVPNNTDGVSFELGIKFKSVQAGQIIAIRYLKAVSETGTHVGKIWTANGALLASVNFSNETASGWQQQNLDTALNIAANTTYIVSVNCNSYYACTLDQLATPIVNGNLSSVADGNNGVYSFSANSFPTNSYRNNNYFRDIVFAYIVVPTITKINGDTQNGTGGSVLPNPLVVQVKDEAGNPKSGVTVNFAVTNGNGAVSPTNAVTDSNGQASTVLTLGALASGSIYTVTNTVSATATSTLR